MDVHNPDGHNVHGSSPVSETDALNEHWREPGDPDGVVRAEEERAERAARLARKVERHTPAKTKRRKHWLRKIIISVLLLIAATYGAFWLGDSKATQDIKSDTKPPVQQNAVVSSNTIKHYESATYLVGVDYPSTWATSDNATALRVISPAIKLKTSAGKQVSGRVVVMLQNKQANIAGYPTDGAFAVLPSEKLTYTHPTTIQRAQTYLSYAGFTDMTSLNMLYITGDNGYLQGQVIPQSDVTRADPLVSVSLVTCATADCAGATTPISIPASDWVRASYSSQVRDILQSLQFN